MSDTRRYLFMSFFGSRRECQEIPSWSEPHHPRVLEAFSARGKRCTVEWLIYFNSGRKFFTLVWRARAHIHIYIYVYIWKRTGGKRREPVASISSVICNGDRTVMFTVAKDWRTGLGVRAYARVCVFARARAAWYIGRLRHSRYSCSSPPSPGVSWKTVALRNLRARISGEIPNRAFLSLFLSRFLLPLLRIFRAFQRVTSTTLHRPLRTRKSAASAPRQCQDTPISSFYAKSTRLE